MDFKNLGEAETRERLIILTDMENEPDDSQTMVRLLVYANEIDIEGLIAVTSRWVREDVFPESIEDRVHAYGVVRDNLMKHADGWPTVEHLLSVTAGGQEGFGMDAVGTGMTSDGAKLIIKAVDKDDPRPVNFAINAGSNTLAEALWVVKETRSEDEVKKFVSKIRVFDDSGQDNSGAWIAHTFPDLFYARSRAQVFGLYGPTLNSGPNPYGGDTEYAWLEKNVRVRHGVLGALYPQRLWIAPPWNHSHIEQGEEDLTRIRYHFTEGGGTATWLGFANKGLFSAKHIHYGGWGGRYERTKTHVSAGQHLVDTLEKDYEPFEMYPQARDTSWKYDGEVAETEFSGVTGDVVYTNEDFAPIWRWRDALTRDFQARMDWCVAAPDKADHPPVIDIAGDTGRNILYVAAAAGEAAEIDASNSRADKGDLSFKWYFYPESGTYPRDLPAESTLGTASVAAFDIPEDSAGSEIHLILEVTSSGIEVPLTSYRRIVFQIA